MFSSKNFINGRIILQEGIYFRFSFLPQNQCALTIEDLRCPQLESFRGSSSGKLCGRIDFSPSETEQLLDQWDTIMCHCFDDLPPQSPHTSVCQSSVFSLLPPGCTLQRLPYGPENRTVCGMETTRSIQVEINCGDRELCFVRQQFIGNVNHQKPGEEKEEEDVEEHVQCCAMVSLDVNRGMRRLDLVIRQLCQLKRLMFPVPSTNILH
jgi:hypothetical protein